MFAIGPIGFHAPQLLAGLLALPLLWWLLRAVPPAAITRRFPAVTLLLGLKDPESTPDKTPWWLLLLRMLALAAIITGFAGPVLNPRTVGKSSARPLLILADASWASARDWADRVARIGDVLEQADMQGRPAAVILLTRGPHEMAELPFRVSRDWKAALPSLTPAPWEPDYRPLVARLDQVANKARAFDTIWLSDGLKRPGRGKLAKVLGRHGEVTVLQSSQPVFALAPPVFRDGKIRITALRENSGPARPFRIHAFGPDPAGIERRLASAGGSFAAGDRQAELVLSLPTDLLNRITRFEIAGQHSAGAVTLSDDALKRRKVVLFSDSAPREGQELLSPLHYLRKALQDTASLIEAPLEQALLAAPDVVILADVGKLAPLDRDALTRWVRKGGLLIRFAGPRLAAMNLPFGERDPLLPVVLRPGGRNVGGAMSWGSPRHLRAFDKESPFFGLAIPDDVTVSSQVVAQPGPDLSGRTIASLQDGTPLVTRASLGKGQVVLFHVTANAEWSTLPLSGLFVKMLERLAVTTRGAALGPEDLKGRNWKPERVLDAYGTVHKADDLPAVGGDRLAAAVTGPDMPPGTYRNRGQQYALNVIAADRSLAPAAWPAGTRLGPMVARHEQPMKGWLLAVALLLMGLDILATLWVAGRLSGARGAVLGILALGLVLIPQPPATAQTVPEQLAVKATRDTVLAYVITGNPDIDATSRDGLRGLSQVLSQRTAIEPASPIGVDLEKDELAFFPLIYWPISGDQALPSKQAVSRINAYLQSGGMILFDTRDADISAFGGTTAAGQRLRQIANSLDIPPLEPVPADHVLTRSFYLLQSFPGRFANGDVWVEAAPPDAVKLEGMPFRNLNDGVSPVVIGGNDWAAAWAVGMNGEYLYPVGRGGYAGERQREMAFRFGVNLVMYVLTGNYKSDQVHVPALLQRLGQ